MIELTDHASGLVLALRAQPGARANAVRGLHRGALKVAVTQVAEKGKANKALLQFLSKTLALRRSQLELLAGETSADKLAIPPKVHVVWCSHEYRRDRVRVGVLWPVDGCR